MSAPGMALLLTSKTIYSLKMNELDGLILFNHNWQVLATITLWANDEEDALTRLRRYFDNLYTGVYDRQDYSFSATLTFRQGNPFVA
jgi:hypothetical protein